MNHHVRVRLLRLLCLSLLVPAVSACDLATADLRAQETAEWRKSYPLESGGRVEIRNINGQIDVEPSSGNTVDVVAVKRARGTSADDARDALQLIEIAETVSPTEVLLETKVQRSGGVFNRGGAEVRYTVRVPPSAHVHFRTVNGGIDLAGLQGRVQAETTNGGIRARDIGGPIEASTTNGGVEVDVTRVTDSGVTLECTNGGIRLRLPADARANISASVTNGGIEADGLTLQTSESSRRRLEAQLNGGGPRVRLSGTNGGIRIASR